MTMLKWNFTALSTSKYETNQHQITEEFSSISINTNTADVKFVVSQDSSCSVVCYEQSNLKHSVSVKDGTLLISVLDSRKWYEHIGINFSSPSITVYIPKGDYGALSINSDTGDVSIPKDYKFTSIDISEDTGSITNFASSSGHVRIKTDTGSIIVESTSANSISLSTSTGRITASQIACKGEFFVGVSTGRVQLIDIRCKNLISRGDTGDISMKNVISTEKLSVERDTGDVRFEGCDAAEIFVKTDTGDVVGSLLSQKIFIVKTDTGSIDVPHSVSGGKCQITTDTGDIRITVK